MTTAVVSPAERQPVWARCEACDHRWVAVYVPMELSRFASVLKAMRCPMCASTSKRHFVYEPGRNPEQAVLR